MFEYLNPPKNRVPKNFASSFRRAPNMPVGQCQAQWTLIVGRNKKRKTLQSVHLWWEGHAGSFPYFRYISHDDNIICRVKHSSWDFSFLVLLLGPSTGSTEPTHHPGGTELDVCFWTHQSTIWPLQMWTVWWAAGEDGVFAARPAAAASRLGQGLSGHPGTN